MAAPVSCEFTSWPRVARHREGRHVMVRRNDCGKWGEPCSEGEGLGLSLLALARRRRRRK